MKLSKQRRAVFTHFLGLPLFSSVPRGFLPWPFPWENHTLIMNALLAAYVAAPPAVMAEPRHAERRFAFETHRNVMFRVPLRHGWHFL